MQHLNHKLKIVNLYINDMFLTNIPYFYQGFWKCGIYAPTSLFMFMLVIYMDVLDLLSSFVSLFNMRIILFLLRTIT